MLTIAWLIIATFFMIFNIVKGRIVYDYLVDSRKVNQYLLALYKVKIFQKIIKKYNLKHLTFHGLRHSGISHMIECGVPISVISRKVGHSSVQVTDAYYSHFFDDEFKQAANSMNDIFEKAQ